MTQTTRKTAAGARKPADSACLRQAPAICSRGGGAATTGGPPVRLPPLDMRLAECLRCRVLHLLRDPVHVLRVLQEVLEQLEETLADGAAELRRLQVGQVEPEDLRVGEPRRRPLLDRVGIGALVDVLVG